MLLRITEGAVYILAADLGGEKKINILVKL